MVRHRALPEEQDRHQAVRWRDGMQCRHVIKQPYRRIELRRSAVRYIGARDGRNTNVVIGPEIAVGREDRLERSPGGASDIVVRQDCQRCFRISHEHLADRIRFTSQRKAVVRRPLGCSN